MLHRLLIAQRTERPGGRTIACGKRPGFFQQSGSEHLTCAVIDALVQRFSVRVETNAKNAEVTEWIAALLPKAGHGRARADADLQSADHLGNIVGMDRLRRRRV